MRVTVISRIYSPEPAAASFFLDAVARALADAGHQVDVLTVIAPRTLIDAPAPNVTVRRFPVFRDRRGYVRGYLQYLSFDIPLAFRMLFRRRPDVYLVEPPPTTGAVVRVIAGLQRRPYVYDAADVWSDAAALATRSRLVLAILRRVELFALNGATQAVTISRAVAERFTALGGGTPFTVTGFGVDTVAFERDPSPEPEKQFVYAGTYSEVHGAEIFVEAFALFSEKHPGYRLRFIGNGAGSTMIEQLRDRLGVTDVAIDAIVPPPTLSAILSRSTASLASVLPGAGYDYALATKVYAPLAVGCPVIFAGVGPTTGVIDDDDPDAPRRGKSVPYDATAIASAMADLAEQPLTASERADLSAWARERHDIRQVAAKVIAVLESAASRRGPRA